MSLTVSSISFGYAAGAELISGLSLSVGAGESAVIMAPSGTGKSTLLSILGGLRAPTAGGVRIERDSEESGAPPRPEVAWVFQAMHLMPRRTVIDNVAVAALARGWARPHAEEVAQRELDRFGVAHLRDRRQSTLSGGESQRVALARASVADPHVVLADEPTANLDAGNARIVAEAFNGGFPRAAVVVATHDPVLAAAATQAYTLTDGRLVRHGKDA